MNVWTYVLFSSVALASAAPAPKDAEALANLKEVLEGELKQWQRRQQDEMLGDVVRKSKDVDEPQNVQARQDESGVENSWTKEDVQLLIERLPEKDITIMRDFAKLAKRLNTARKLVRQLNQLQAKPKRNLNHPISGFDPKVVGTREQDMVEKEEAEPAVKEGITNVAETEANGSQWLQRPLSKAEIEKALSLLNQRNSLRKRQDDLASSVAKNEKSSKPSYNDKSLEEAVLTALLVMEKKAGNKQK